jgi:hypothetical protein
MKVLKTSVFLIIALIGVAISAFAQQKDKTQAKQLEEKIVRLIHELRDNDLDTRERAREELIKIGKPSLESLKKELAKEGLDPEVKWRAELILKEIRKNLIRIVISEDKKIYKLRKITTCGPSFGQYYINVKWAFINESDQDIIIVTPGNRFYTWKFIDATQQEHIALEDSGYFILYKDNFITIKKGETRNFETPVFVSYFLSYSFTPEQIRKIRRGEHPGKSKIRAEYKMSLNYSFNPEIGLKQPGAEELAKRAIEIDLWSNEVNIVITE